MKYKFEAQRRDTSKDVLEFTFGLVKLLSPVLLCRNRALVTVDRVCNVQVSWASQALCPKVSSVSLCLFTALQSVPVTLLSSPVVGSVATSNS